MSRNMIAFPWYGGKYMSLKWLLPLIESVPHTTYVEPFGGSAVVILNKKKSPVDVYNDIYSDVVNFFTVLRNQGDDLMRLIELTPYSREEFSSACLDRSGSNLERARKFFVIARQVRLGLATTASPGRWAYGIEHSRRGMALNVSRWLSSIDSLPEICSRLKDIQLENLDAINLIKRYDREGTLFYVDPPYLMETRSGGVGYANEYDDNKHQELLNLLKNTQGKVILSGYSSDLYNNQLKDWDVYSGGAKINPNTKMDSDRTREEIVWTNFKLDGDLFECLL